MLTDTEQKRTLALIKVIIPMAIVEKEAFHRAIGKKKSRREDVNILCIDRRIEFEGRPSLNLCTFVLPMKLVCSTNSRECWREIATRKKAQRRIAELATSTTSARFMASLGKVLVTITRIGKRRMDDDNLQTSAKYVRDGIADAMNLDDGDQNRVEWKYAQEIGKEYGCRVEIMQSDECRHERTAPGFDGAPYCKDCGEQF